MSRPIPINQLNVIGYATKLTEAMLPTVVAPVFGFKNAQDRIVFPPLKIYQGEVHDATEGDLSEFEALSELGEVSKIDRPVEAKPCFELWIDDDMQPLYEDEEVVSKRRAAIARDALQAAEAALRDSRLEEAERLASRSVSADDRRWEALALKASLRRREGRENAVRVMARLAIELCSSHTFEHEVEHFTEAIGSSVGHFSVPEPVVMAGFARFRPEEILNRAR